MKIVSLVPSLTELLFDFGIDPKNIVGRTKFCIHPSKLVNKVEVIGGTKNLNIDKIKQINPDLILANKEENTKEQIEELMSTHKVMVTNVGNLEDNYYLLKNLGHQLNKVEIAQQYNLKIQEHFDFTKPSLKLKAAYFIWKEPYMTVGGDTFISSILEELGFENLFKNAKRYPIIDLQAIEKADVIFLSSEPYPFKEKHILEIQNVYPNKKIFIVDGEAFSWYGTRIAKLGTYYQDLIRSVNL